MIRMIPLALLLSACSSVDDLPYIERPCHSIDSEFDRTSCELSKSHDMRARIYGVCMYKSTANKLVTSVDRENFIRHCIGSFPVDKLID